MRNRFVIANNLLRGIADCEFRIAECEKFMQSTFFGLKTGIHGFVSHFFVFDRAKDVSSGRAAKRGSSVPIP
jgi:hypothetical protein